MEIGAVQAGFFPQQRLDPGEVGRQVLDARRIQQNQVRRTFARRDVLEPARHAPAIGHQPRHGARPARAVGREVALQVGAFDLRTGKPDGDPPGLVRCVRAACAERTQQHTRGQGACPDSRGKPCARGMVQTESGLKP
jgi:hypothetical protein